MEAHKILTGVGCAAVLALTAQATMITVDEYVVPGGVDINEVLGSVDMELNGDVLSVTLVNLSSDAAGNDADILLTGIGFNLPGNVLIASGLADMSGSTAVGFTAPADGNVSSEWGYDNAPLNSGALVDRGIDVNTAVSSMESQTTAQFAPGSIADPLNLNGPDFGLLSMLETGGLGAGVEAIEDSLRIDLTLSGLTDFPDDLLDFIEGGTVALTYGSPGDGTSVPDGGATVALLGLAMLGVEGLRRTFRKN